MNRNKTLLLLALLGISFASFQSCKMKKDKTEDVPVIPLEDFFRNPEKSSFSISDDGEYYAYLAPFESRMNVFVQRIGEEQAKQLTSEKDRDIAGMFWKGSKTILFMKDNGGDENFALYGVNIDSGSVRAYTKLPNVKTQVIDDLEEDPVHVIVGLNQRNPEIFDAYRLNIETGELKMIAQNPGNYSAWMTDHEGRLRVAITTDGVNNSLLYRPSEDSAFRVVLTTNFKESFSPQLFDFEDSSVMIGTSNLGRDKSALVKFDMNTGKEIGEIFKDDLNDISGVAYSKKRKVLTTIYWTADKMKRKILDNEVKDIYAVLEGKLPGVEIYLTSRDKDEKHYIVRTHSDKTRGTYYSFNVNNNELIKLADLSPWLKESQMAMMKPISYKSRDGLTINGYLTLPVGVKAENLPVIVNPHGGPWARDEWGFNPEVQFLANRGYAVLQMNFRGSTGYGREFWEASFKQWGQTMQNDISDGVRWLVDEGIADQNRIAIYGGSYGGYATLAGVTFTPDLYTCAVDYVGVSNLFTFMETIPPYWKQYLDMLHEMVGDPEKDKAMMTAYSPVFHVDKIKAPLFIAQGANDPRVKQSESDQIVEALKKRGVEVEYLLKKNEGHGFRNEENRYDFYRAMEKFLAKHMGMTSH
ncbi:MAG: prolyl oligopeptidase family serine peptidase [Bacteroidetes bacterium]|nr:prolyl oligopeptidase family serine peptidase [Bacteroidota bacterium]